MNRPEPETPVVFECDGTELLGILHRGSAQATRAVLIAVGGPQYRVGSHRQFVLLARRLADAGIPTLRFDYRGMGDSAGEARSFENIGSDLRAAIDRLYAQRPRLREVVLWGLCDAASACALYAPTDPRVAGLVLLNPWVRTASGEARAYLRHYYLGRLLSRGFWRKALGGQLDLRGSWRGMIGFLVQARDRRDAEGSSATTSATAAAHAAHAIPLPQRMLRALEAFDGRTLLILSGNDLTAQEFSDLLRASRRWRRWARRATVARRALAPADHTFSSQPWRAQVEDWTLDWLRAWPMPERRA